MGNRRCGGTAASLLLLPGLLPEGCEQGTGLPFPPAWGCVPAPPSQAVAAWSPLGEPCLTWPPPRCPAGSDDCTVRFWEVCTARCMKTLPVGSVVKSIAWNPNPTVCLVAICV